MFKCRIIQENYSSFSFTSNAMLKVHNFAYNKIQRYSIGIIEGTIGR